MTFPEAVSTARDDLRQIVEDIERTVHEVDAGAPRAVLRDVLDFVADAANHRELLGSNPERSFEAGLAMLNEADRRLFMLRNVLESLKRGEDPRATLRHYQNLGLLSRDEPLPPPPPAISAEVEEFQTATARAAQWAGKQLKRAISVVTGLTVEAARAIPKLANVKMGVTFVAGIPCPSFQLEAGSAQWDLASLLQHIQASYTNAKV